MNDTYVMNQIRNDLAQTRAALREHIDCEREICAEHGPRAFRSHKRYLRARCNELQSELQHMRANMDQTRYALWTAYLTD